MFIIACLSPIIHIAAPRDNARCHANPTTSFLPVVLQTTFTMMNMKAMKVQRLPRCHGAANLKPKS
jgi:hypothetical protein